jgi:hypothetical protein
VAEGGNVANDPHNEFTNRNILYQATSLADTATQFRQIEEVVAQGIEDARRVLLEARAKRVRPHLDDKILTSWNGLMISAFALGGAVLGDSRYAAAARNAAEFLIGRMYDAESGVLLRRYRQGDAAIPGFLDDYALFTQALLDLYETQFDLRHLKLAVRLTEKQAELFEDREQGGLFSSPEGDSALVIRIKEDYDGAEPSGNSVALMNLLRLGEITNRADFRASADRLLAAFAPRLSAAAVALPYMLAACEFRLSGPRQIIFVTPGPGTADAPQIAELYRHFVPGKIVLLVDSPESRRELAGWIPAIGEMQAIDNRATAYVCREYTCQLPVTGVDEFAKLIQ